MDDNFVRHEQGQAKTVVPNRYSVMAGILEASKPAWFRCVLVSVRRHCVSLMASSALTFRETRQGMWCPPVRSPDLLLSDYFRMNCTHNPLLTEKQYPYRNQKHFSRDAESWYG